jgi:cysteine desulfurase
MWANNETGVVFPIAQLAALAHAAGALFHTDAVQAAGKVPVNVAAAGVDMASLSAHKFHGPKGIGALSVRKGVKFQPLLRGGRQERGRRAGTENVPAIAGFGKAAELALQALGSAMPAVEALRNTLADLLVARIDGALVLGVGAPRVPNTLDIAFEGIESDSMLLRLDQAGIAASSGSACSSGSMEPSHVLRAMKVPFGFIHGAVRLSLSRETTAAQIDYAASVLPKIIGKLRESTLAAPISEPGVLVGDRP